MLFIIHAVNVVLFSLLSTRKRYLTHSYEAQVNSRRDTYIIWTTCPASSSNFTEQWLTQHRVFICVHPNLKKISGWDFM